MKNILFVTCLLTLATSVFADCRPELSQGSNNQKKLSSAIYGAYIFKASTNIREEFGDLGKKVNSLLSQKISITELAEAVVQSNTAKKFCSSLNIKSYARSLAQEITSRPEILKPVVVIPFEPPLNMESDLEKGMMPRLFKKRDAPVLNIGLIYYGDYYQEADLEKVRILLEERWNISTDQAITLHTVFKAIVPFKHNLADYPDYRQKNVTDPERLQRLWYYDNVGNSIMNEVYLQVQNNPELKGDLANIDALAIVTGAQFDGLGFASGRVAITENPMEIAWGGGGWVEYVTDARVVDELIHELGHTLYLDHAASQCGKFEDPIESKACCDSSPSGNDVMSYCRQRNKVSDKFFYKFEACNLKLIKEKIVPAMLSGDVSNTVGQEVCN